MITIFHGDDNTKSREAFLVFVKQSEAVDVLALDSKNVELDKLTNFLGSGSLFSGKKALTISNFFSLSKPVLAKVIPLIQKSGVDVVLWQDKPLNAAQLKTFPKAEVFSFKADNSLYACLNSVKPKNLVKFTNNFDKVVAEGLFDLFYYLLKGSLRRQLQSRSLFDNKQLLKTYLQLIELEFQYKTGQLSFPREIALKRVMVLLLK